MSRNCAAKTTLLFLIGICMTMLLCMCREFNPSSEEIGYSSIEAIDIDDPLTYISSTDTIAKWQNWAMRSDEGLWENDSSHDVQLSLQQMYGGEDNPNPPFFSVKWMQVSGDTLFIADRARECLVCMTSNGEVLWEYGAPGEGPGCFSRIGSIAVSDSWLAICNIDGDRVELISRAGEPRQAFEIINPLYVEAINSETFAVLSRAEAGGDIHLFDINNGYLVSFGECPWQGGELIQRSTNAFSAQFINNRYLVVNHFFEYKIVVFDVLEEELVTEFVRNHPSGSLPSSSVTEFDDGGIAGTFYFLLGKMFVGPEGAINVRLDAIQKDGSVINSRTTIGPAPVTIIDRYNLAGEYLDSYCVPLPNCTEFRYSAPYLYVSQSFTGTVYQFLVQ